MPPKKTVAAPAKKDPKKVAEVAATKEQFDLQKTDVVLEEERVRSDVLITEKMARKEFKAMWRQDVARHFVILNQKISLLTSRITEITRTSGLQIVKLEDELSRLGMSKEVIVQENILLKNEVAQLKSDDGGKQMITQLNSKLRQMEGERIAKNKEYEDAAYDANRKLAKQITENRLMRIQQKDTESEWVSRVQSLERTVMSALDKLLEESENPSVARVTNFQKSVEKSKADYIDALRAVRLKMSFVDDLVDLKSMHSNIPVRIKAKLDLLSTDELLLIIEALSFEESVVQFLEAKFPDER